MYYQNESDETLVMLTLAGEQSAYEVLVIRYQKAVIASAITITKNHFMAEDAAQEIRLFHGIHEMSVQYKSHKSRREDTVHFLPISCFHRETYDLRCMITVAGFYRYGKPKMQPAHKKIPPILKTRNWRESYCVMIHRQNRVFLFGGVLV